MADATLRLRNVLIAADPSICILSLMAATKGLEFREIISWSDTLRSMSLALRPIESSQESVH